MEPASRRVVTRSPKRTVGILNLPWFQDRPVEHESRLEKHFVLRAALFGPLKRIIHQPFKLPLEKAEYYTPDFLLEFGNGQRAVVEVKRSEKIKPLISRFDQISSRLAADKLPFFVIHNGQIEGELRAQRAALLRRYGKLAVSECIAHSVRDAVAAHSEGVQIGKLRRQCGAATTQLYALLVRRVVSSNPKVLLSDDDLVFPTTMEVCDAANQFGNWFGCTPWRTHA